MSSFGSWGGLFPSCRVLDRLEPLHVLVVFLSEQVTLWWKSVLGKSRASRQMGGTCRASMEEADATCAVRAMLLLARVRVPALAEVCFPGCRLCGVILTLCAWYNGAVWWKRMGGVGALLLCCAAMLHKPPPQVSVRSGRCSRLCWC